MKLYLLILFMSFIASCSSYQSKPKGHICVLTLYYNDWAGELITDSSNILSGKKLILKQAVFDKPRTPDMGAEVKSIKTDSLPKELEGISLTLEHSREKSAEEEMLSIKVTLWENDKKIVGPVESILSRRISENYLGHQSSPLLKFEEEYKNQSIEVIFRCN